MLSLDDQAVSAQDLEQQFALLRQLADTHNWYGRRLAFCTSDIFQWLALVLFCRQNSISLAPIHGDTPEQAAGDKAAEMGCDFLLWQTATHTRPLTPNAIHSRPAVENTRAGLLQFSSGTTGRPKLIARSWASIDREIKSYNRALGPAGEFQPVVACPISHSYGLISGVLSALERGREPHIVSGINSRHLLSVVDRYQQPLVYSSPQFLYTATTLLAPGKKLFAAMTSGTVMPAPWFTSVQQKTGYLLQQYGCSEAGCISVAHRPSQANMLGKPLDHIRLSDDFLTFQQGDPPSESSAAGSQNGSPVSPQEILVEVDEQRIQTQDLGYGDNSGNLYFFSRQDDTIIVSGFNVYPAEVEDVLLAHPDIDDVVVFRLPDNTANILGAPAPSDSAGSRVAALYCGKRELKKSEMRRWCQQALAPYQWPTVIEKLPRIPRLPNGKISRRQLTRDYLAGCLNQDAVA